VRFNSTIIPKKKKLLCGCYDYPFSKGRCKKHATIEDTQKRFAEAFDSEDESLPELIKEADGLFSKYIRLKYSDKSGIAKCYTCPKEARWQEMQCGHYVSRSALFLRWDERNARVQCPNCNEYKHGNLAVYGQNLESESNGIAEILFEESKIIYKPTRDEIRSIITELKNKLKKYNL